MIDLQQNYVLELPFAYCNSAPAYCTNFVLTFGWSSRTLGYNYTRKAVYLYGMLIDLLDWHHFAWATRIIFDCQTLISIVQVVLFFIQSCIHVAFAQYDSRKEGHVLLNLKQSDLHQDDHLYWIIDLRPSLSFSSWLTSVSQYGPLENPY